MGGAYFFDVAPADTYEKNYQYDRGALLNVTCYQGMSTVAMVNAFTTSGSDKIDAVSFFTNNADVNYGIAIYTDLANTSYQNSGKLRTYQSESLKFVVYSTIPLIQPVELIKDKTFSVVVTLSKDSRKAGEEL